MYARVIRFRLLPSALGQAERLARDLEVEVAQQFGPATQSYILRSVDDPAEMLLFFVWDEPRLPQTSIEGTFERAVPGAMPAIAERTDKLYSVVD